MGEQPFADRGLSGSGRGRRPVDSDVRDSGLTLGVQFNSRGPAHAFPLPDPFHVVCQRGQARLTDHLAGGSPPRRPSPNACPLRRAGTAISRLGAAVRAPAVATDRPGPTAKRHSPAPPPACPVTRTERRRQLNGGSASSSVDLASEHGPIVSAFLVAVGARRISGCRPAPGGHIQVSPHAVSWVLIRSVRTSPEVSGGGFASSSRRYVALRCDPAGRYDFDQSGAAHLRNRLACMLSSPPSSLAE